MLHQLLFAVVPLSSKVQYSVFCFVSNSYV